MNSYLKIARLALEAAKKPLSARQMLEFAYLQNLTPSHLHGLTQHKTLQARLSEDILENGTQSEFYRTEPGVFFLRQYLEDTLPSELQEFHSRRRERDLRKHPVLTIKKEDLLEQITDGDMLEVEKFKTLFSISKAKYTPYGETDEAGDAIVWSFVVICKGQNVLSYRKGRYREKRDNFLNKQTIGFKSLVTSEDRTLFDQNDHGLVWGGVSKAMVDLGMPLNVLDDKEFQSRSKLRFLMACGEDEAASEVVGVVTFDCPEWFEPTTRRLAVNDLTWLDLQRKINHIEDFDPWSQKVLEKIKLFLFGKGVEKLDSVYPR